jgi:ATP-dependent phosphofructokinase / diphosphate-dependent phosphofructokinase
MNESSGVRRVGIVFAGGPAPAANAVIAAAVTCFRRSGREVVGFMDGYSNLMEYDAKERPLVEGQDWFLFQDQHLRGARNSRGIIVGTARANPGKALRARADLDDPHKTALLARVCRGLLDTGIDALVSIGGDDTLKTANFVYEYQRRQPPGSRHVRVVHVPKTIDNDYRGIDFTFGFFTAVDMIAKELLNLRADAMATKSYFVVETMGRKAGWLAYGVAVAGEAHMVVGVEDVTGDLLLPGTDRLSLDGLCERIIDLILTRERGGKHYGTIVLAEGLAETLPETELAGVPLDEHGHVSLGRVDIGKLVAERVGERFYARTGRKKKLTGVQLGYESRCASPHAFDVMLGSQLGVGAYRALCEENLEGHMVSVKGQLDLTYVPFAELIDPETLETEVRYVRPGSDFHRLAHQIETRIEHRLR